MYKSFIDKLNSTNKVELITNVEEPKVEFHTDIINEAQLKKGDIIVLTFDTNIWDLDECKNWTDFFIEAFPNQVILAKPNGVHLDILHTGKEEEKYIELF